MLFYRPECAVEPNDHDSYCKWQGSSECSRATADFDRLTDAIELPPLVSVTEAATALGMSRQGVLKAIRAEKLPATRVGDTWALR